MTKKTKKSKKKPKKLKTGSYRCSCCNEMTVETRHIYVPWTSPDDPEYDETIVAICSGCDSLIKKCNMYNVLQFRKFCDSNKGILQ